MSDEAATADTQTFKSISDAAAFITAQREAQKEEAPEADADPFARQENSEAVPHAAEDDSVDPVEDNYAEDDGEDAEPDFSAIQPPQFLGKEDREVFASLPREAQEIVSRIEEQGRRAVGQRLNEVANERRAIQAQMQHLEAVTAGVDGYVGELDREIAQYDGIDWDLEIAEANTDRPLPYVLQQQAHANRLRQQKAEALQMQTKATAEQLRVHQAQTAQLLEQIAPHLSPRTKEGAERVSTMGKFLADQGADADTLAWFPAWAFPLVEDAMRYRAQRQSVAQKASQAPPPKPPAGPTVAPVTAGRHGSPQQSRLKALNGKQSLSLAEAAELQQLNRAKKRR